MNDFEVHPVNTVYLLRDIYRAAKTLREQDNAPRVPRDSRLMAEGLLDLAISNYEESGGG